MSAEVHQLPISINVTVDAWNAYDCAMLHLQALYADPDSTREERLAASMECARLWRRWKALFLRGAA